MKSLLFIFLTVLIGLSVFATKIWIIASFLIYLFKDQPFDWWSVWCSIISWVLLIVLYPISIYYSKKQKQIIESAPGQPGLPKSKFQTRLDAAILERERRNFGTK